MHLSSQIDANTTNNINNDSILLNNVLSNIDTDIPFESLPLFNKTILITPIKADKAVTSTAHNATNGQSSSVIHTNFIYYSNNKSNDNVNDTRSNRYTDPIPRRYTCRECGISFHQNVHLRKHIMVQHTKVKPYHCPYCEYTTVEKSHLTVHIRIHTGERPYSCRECNYSSAQNCTLKSHYLRKHPTNLIACDYCSELFFTELELSKHHRSCRVAVRQ
ncbi:Zinc finger protein [Schistosoma japonicum]|uniref:Zinc finger protein n=1 Tax=Schistosoma japonicum TaxID=6182 RepID=A0A4Z2DDZ7_SCHJA|nr:Zinc finger protein [Schistosoma japonicum]